MRFLARSLTGLLILALTGGLLAMAGYTVVSAISDAAELDDRGRSGRERVFAVAVETVDTGDVTPVIETFGEIQSSRTLELRAGAAGEVVWLAENFEEGALVRAGELLVSIDDRDAMGRRDTAQADLAEAEAELRDATRTLDLARAELAAARGQADLRVRALAREQDMLNRGVGTDKSVEDAEIAASSAEQSVLASRQSLATADARVDFARIALVRREIALAEAERDLADTQIRAGFDGRLTNVRGVEGRLVSANEALGELINASELEASFRVSAAQYARLVDTDGTLRPARVTVSLEVGELGLLAEGRLTRESPAVGDGQTGRLLFAELAAPGGFRQGDFVTVRIDEPALERVAVLPASALDIGATVLALGADDRLEALETRLLRRQGDAVIVEASGLEGREVVSERSPFLGVGIKVRPLRDGGAPSEPSGNDGLVELDDERRARLVAFVEANQRMPADAKERVLAQLRQDRVPLRVVARIEERMGG
ncbi:MAG: efflux transporter periplasmic adaptor subunit [Pseudomonadota bacterium]